MLIRIQLFRGQKVCWCGRDTDKEKSSCAALYLLISSSKTIEGSVRKPTLLLPMLAKRSLLKRLIKRLIERLIKVFHLQVRIKSIISIFSKVFKEFLTQVHLHVTQVKKYNLTAKIIFYFSLNSQIIYGYSNCSPIKNLNAIEIINCLPFKMWLFN